MALIQKLIRPVIKLDDDGKEIERKIDPENKQYLILIFYNGNKDSATDRTFEVITGRTPVYEYLKQKIEDIDILKSHVIVQDDTLENCPSVYSFMKYIKDYYFEDDEFDIEDYRKDDEDIESPTENVQPIEEQEDHPREINNLLDNNNDQQDI